MGKVIVFLLVAVLALLAPLAYLLFEVSPEIAQGDASFMKAQQGESVLERYVGYNEALSHYLYAERKSPLLFRDYRMALRTAETLFALRAYPAASYYFWTAYNDHPSKMTREGLERVLKRLGMQESVEPSTKLPVSYTLLVLLCALFLLAAGTVKKSLYLSTAAGAASFCLFGYLGWLFYFAPLEGVLLERQPLVSLDGVPSAIMLEAGTKLRLLSDEESLVKVLTEQGVIGYLPDRSIRALR